MQNNILLIRQMQVETKIIAKYIAKNANTCYYIGVLKSAYMQWTEICYK